MKHTHLLEMSSDEPRQYRVTVIEDKEVSILNHIINHPVGDGFRVLGYFDTPDELMAVLVPYLQMEDSK